MTPQVREILHEPTGADFRSDVQIADYWSESNLGLLKHYIFTSRAPAKKKSSVELVRTFCEAFVPGATENRFVVVATYGHGKSHFALTLANYFGRENDSIESGEVLKAIRHAIPDQDLGTYGFIEDFKREHKRFLILILRGDEPNDLPTKIHRALKQALPDGSDLPFWFQIAEKWLEERGKELRSKVDEFLRKDHLDLDSLLAKVRDRDASVHDICVKLVQQLTGVREPFAEGFSLAEVITWVVDNKCGTGKPYDGLLILFDEFSTFILSYGRSDVRGTHLQDLLNGVRDRPERSAFIAFAQLDPDEVARRTIQGFDFDLIKKELERLPPPKRYQFHSSLEEVLESTLQKKAETWDDLLKKDKSFVKALEQATDKTWLAFSRRYSEELKLTLDRFNSLVTEGCYPLHPLTTSLLCSVELEATANPRSILGFVQEAIEKHSDDPVMGEAGPTWVRAVSLVDYFKEMLGEEHLGTYKNALSVLNQPDEPQAHAVLKAMLLVEVGRVSTEKVGYAKIIAELSGLSVASAESFLVQLTQRSIIRQDPVTDNYTIAPLGWGGSGERIAQTKIQQVRLDAQTFENHRDDIEKLGLEHVALSIGWGHADDWYAKQILVERAMLTTVYLQGVVKRYVRWTLTDNAKQKARARGLVVWLLAKDEDDVEWYRSHLSELIRDAISEEVAPPPLVVMRPVTPSTELIERLKRYIALRQFTPSERDEAHVAWHTETLAQAKTNLKNALESYRRSNVEFEVPAQFKSRLDSVGFNNLNFVLSEVLRLAYPHGPKQWFDQYKLESPTMRTAVSQVCMNIIQRGKIEQSFFDGKPVAKDIVFRYLRDSWHVIDGFGRPVQASQGSPVKRGWDFLESGFPTGKPSANVGLILDVLLNPPYGYDWNELALLFTAWWAYYRHDLEVTGSWSPNASGTSPKPHELLEMLGKSSIRRREDPTGEVRKLVEDVRSGSPRSRTEAGTQVRTLEEFLQREEIELTLKGSANEALDRLKEALALADNYDSQVKQIRIDSVRNNLQDMLSCLSKVKNLPSCSLVGAEMPPLEQIGTEVRKRIDDHVDAFCTKYGSLKQLEDYGINENQLLQASKRLMEAGLTNSVQKVAEGIAALERARKDLGDKQLLNAQRREQETFLNNLPLVGSVNELRKSLDKLDGMIPQPEVETLRGQKHDALSQELTRLEEFAKSFGDALDKASDEKAVSQLRDKAIRLQDRYDDAEASSLVAEGIRRCDLLISFFGEVAGFRNSKPANPQDFGQAIDGIRLTTESNSKHLSESQKAATESIIKALNVALANQRQGATRQLENLQQELNRGVLPQKIKTKLDGGGSAWVFLEHGDATALDNLLREVQKRLTQDEVDREEKAREQAELKRQEDFIKGLSVRRPMSELRQGLEALDGLNQHPGVKTLWEKKHSDMVTELDRLTDLPRVLSLKLDPATKRSLVEACKEEGLQSRDRCDEGETQKQLDRLLERCKAIWDCLEYADNIMTQVRASPQDFDRDTAALRKREIDGSGYLSDTQRHFVKNTIAGIEGALSAKQAASRERLAQFEKVLERGESMGKVHQDMERENWSFLPTDAMDSLERLKGQVQERLDGDESQQVELHFSKIRDKRLRRKCLETLQRLVEEDV